MQIVLDIKTMNTAEREHLAGFILAYPTAKLATVGDVTISGNSAIDPKVIAIKTTPYAVGDNDGEMTILQHDQDSTLPELAFGGAGDLEANKAFGGANPLVPPATHAQGIVDAGQSTTAPVVDILTADTTLTAQVDDQPGNAQTVVDPSNLVETDKHGLPWDHRIHSESRTKVADGSWRKKRGCDAGLVAQVESELRQVMSATGPTIDFDAQHCTGHVDYAPESRVPPPPAAVVTPPPPPTAVVTPPAPPASADINDAKQQYTALIGRASAAIGSKRVTLDAVNAVCALHGVPALPLLINRPDLVPTVVAEIDAIIQAAPL